METQYISLNMTPTGVNPCFHISQYDVGRMLGFIVHSGGATVDLDTYTCTIEATRSDGTAITSAVATTDNIGTFEVTPTMSNKTDKYRCQLVIVDANSKRIASLPFDMEVTKAAMDENSEAIEEDASLYQQYTEAVQGAIAEANADIQAEKNARIAAVNAEATARQNADATLQNNIDAEATARQSADNTLQGNINSEAATRASADSNLQSQINQIVAPSGEAPSAAEVQNARIGADGVTYDTLGTAIRTQFNNLNNDIVSNSKRNLVNLGAQKVVKGRYYLDRSFDASDYYTWYFDLSPYNTNRFIVTALSPAYTNFVTFLDENMNNVGHVANSSANEVVKSNMYVIKPENAKYIAITTSYLTPSNKNLLVSACISLDEIQGFPFYTSDNGEDVDVCPIIILKGTTEKGKLDSPYVPGTTMRAALYIPKSNCDIKIKCVGKFNIYYGNGWTKEAIVNKKDTGRWIDVQNESNTDFEDVPTGEDIKMVALSNKLHDVVAKPYCVDITNTFTYNQATNNTIPFTPSDIRVTTSLFNPPQKETIMISVPDTIDVTVDEFILEDGVYSRKHMYEDFAANIDPWLGGTFYCNVYPERYYTIMIRNKDNSPISAGQVYKYLHVYAVDNRFHIPEYYRDYMSQKEKEILENTASFNSFAFAFITDIHIQRNTKHSPALIRRITKTCAIKNILGGGDWQTAWNSDEQGKNAIVDDMIELRDLFFDVPMIKTIGNHEWAYGGKNQYNISTDEAYNIYYRSDEEKAKSEIVYPENGNGTYFYSDDKTNKIRYISVNCMDYADNLDISQYNKEWYFSISEEQISWLKSSLNLPSNDWLCVVFSHVPLWTSSERPFESGTLVVNADRIGEIISDYTSKTGDFSAHKGTLVCWLAGHTHRDALIEWHGTHMVVTNGDCFIQAEGAQTRTLGTTSEQCFDIFCINKKERNVKIVRIGAGENREFSF